MVDKATQDRWAAEDGLRKLRDGWEDAASRDAMFNILTHPGKEGNWVHDEFFMTGRLEINRVMEQLDGVLTSFGTALDFGCGIGRLSAALNDHFDRVIGVDISSEMLRQARRNVPDAQFVQVKDDNLAMFKDGQFDFVYTHIVIQHMPVPLQETFVKELNRVGKLVMFDTIDGPNHPHPWIGMNTVPRHTVETWLDGEIVREFTTDEEGWTRTFMVVSNG